MIRLNSLEAQLEDVERERSEISELQAKSIADENALAEAAARLEASEIEKDDVQAELRILGAEMEDMRRSSPPRRRRPRPRGAGDKG